MKKRWFFVTAVGLLAAYAFAPRPAPELPMTQSHHGQQGFINPGQAKLNKSLLLYTKMRVTTPHPNQRDNLHHVPVVATELTALQQPLDAPRATWIGHSTVLLQHAGKNVLTDPMFSKRASPSQLIGPGRYFAPSVALNDLPKIDAVVISHNHYDHMDKSSIKHIANQPGWNTQWYVPLENARYLESFGVSRSNIHQLDWWESVSLGDVTFTATPSQHWSKRTAWDTNYALWSAWAIDMGGWKVWFGGDTGYHPQHFAETGKRLGPFDLGIIPIGAYNPQWFMGPMHINPEEAVQIHREVRAKQSFAVHWGTFQLTAEPVHEPAERLRAATENMTEGDFVTLAIGETKTFSIIERQK